MGRSLFRSAALMLCLASLWAVAARGDAALPDALTAGWQGRPVCELLYETPTNRVLRCTFAPGVGHERHFHPRHFGYALSGGRMRITTASGVREAEIATGSSFSSEGVAWHEVLNVGPTPVIYLMFEEKPARSFGKAH